MKKEELRLDYLKNHPEVKLYQSKEMFRINTDTCLLGEFISCNEDDNVLDVGTNNGALLLYASLQTKGHLVGIDINEEALQIASLNMKEHNITSVTLLHQDFSSFSFSYFCYLISMLIAQNCVGALNSVNGG